MEKVVFSVGGRVFAHGIVTISDPKCMRLMVEYTDGKTPPLIFELSHGWQGIQIHSTVFDVCCVALHELNYCAFWIKKATRFAPNPDRPNSRKIQNGSQTCNDVFVFLEL